MPEKKEKLINKFNNHKKQYIILFISILIILFINSSYAKQDQIRVIECNLSYNDPDFNPWDGVRGVVMQVINTNPNFGSTQDPIYQYKFPLEEGIYFRNANPPTQTTKIPMLNATQGTLSMYAYIRCAFEVGGGESIPEGTLTNDKFYLSMSKRLTDDFNLAALIGTRTLSTWTVTESTGSSYSSPYSYFGIPAIETKYPKSGLSTDTIGRFDSGSTFQKTFEFILNNYYPSLVYLEGIFKVQGGWVAIEPYFDMFFYINSSNPIGLCSNAVNYTANKTSDGQAIYSGPDRTSLIFNYNDQIDEICIDLKNPYPTPITNKVRLNYPIFVSTNSLGGVASSITDVNTFINSQYSEQTILIEAGQIQHLCWSIPTYGHYTIPSTYNGKPVVIPNLYSSFTIYDTIGNICTGKYPLYGSDGILYLGIQGLTAKIAYDPTVEKPYFGLDMNLRVFGGSGASDLAINPNDYAINITVYEKILVGDVVYGKEINLNEEEFQRMGKACPGANCKLAQNEIINDYNTKIHFDPDIGIKFREIYKVKLCMKKLTGTHAGLLISCIESEPEFQPGDIAYGGGTLTFGKNSRVQSPQPPAAQKLLVSNPTFSPIDITLTPNWVDDNNFEISWLGQDGPYTRGSTITIRNLAPWPLGNKVIDFWVRANHEPWPYPLPIEGINKKLQIVATSEQIANPTILYYTLNLRDSLDWFNLYPLNVQDRGGNCVEQGATENTQDIELNWEAIGSDPDGDGPKILKYYGENYDVTVTLTKEDGSACGECGVPVTESFSVSENEENLFFSRNLPTGRYRVEYNIDSTNALSERIPDQINIGQYLTVEADNIGSYILNVRECPITDDSESCAEFTSQGGEKCNEEHTYNPPQVGIYLCAWNCNNRNCPPNDPDDYLSAGYGECKACDDVKIPFSPCAGYNNQKTCEADPCRESQRGCNEIYDCGTSLDYECRWESDNTCRFYLKGCTYDTQEIESCSTEGVFLARYQITGTPSDPSITCINKEVKFPCPRKIKLPFFNIFSLIFSIVLIVVIYVLKKKIKHR